MRSSELPDPDSGAGKAVREYQRTTLDEDPAFLKLLLGNVPAFIAVFGGPELRFEHANEAYYQLVGHREIIGRPLAEAFPESLSWGDGQAYDSLLRQVMEKGDRTRLPARPVSLQREPGAPPEEHFLDLSHQPLKDPNNGSFSRVLVFGVDVTEHTRIQRALAASEERLRKTVSVATVGVLFFNLDGTIVDANAAFEQMSGWTLEQLRATPYWEQLTPPEFEDLTALKVRELAQYGQTAPYEKQLLRPDGSRWWGLFSPSRLSVSDSDAQCIEFAVNITERKAAEEAVRLNEELFKTVFLEAPDDAVVVTDPERRILAWNPAAERICGWTAEEVKGQPIEIIFTEEDKERGRALEEAEEAARSGKTRDERWHAGKGGVLFYASGTTNAICATDGSVRFFVKVFRDTTERFEQERRNQELNEELEKKVADRTRELLAKNKELESFSYSVSHDLRAPLRGIVGNARIVLDEEGPKLSKSGRENLQRLESAGLKMAELVDDLLQYARLGQREIRKQTVDMGELVEQVRLEMESDFPDCALTFNLACDATVQCDPAIIGMALRNLFENACKYRKPGVQARVEFRCEELNGERVFSVRDSGIGFSKQYLHKLFKPFERLHRDEYAGTGIGLANVKRAIERHNGRIWAEGEPGVGATFFFTLP